MLRTSLTAVQRHPVGPRPTWGLLSTLGRVLAATTLVAAAHAGPFEDPSVEFTTTSVAGDEGGGDLIATLSLSAPAAADVTVPYTLTGTATDITDYGLDLGSPITILAGQTTVDITLTPVADALDELDETAILTLGTPTGATLGVNQEFTFTVNDDDAPPAVTFSVASQSGAEDGNLTVDVQLDAPSGLEVSVPLSLTGTALDGTDYSLRSNPVVVLAGETTTTLTFQIRDDVTDEDDETIIATMEAPTNATLGATTVHTATVTDDDDPPTVQFSQASQSAGENAGATPVEVSLSVASGKEISVRFTLSGTAFDPDDFSLSAAAFVIPVGQATMTIDLVPVDDVIDEEDETAVFTLGAPTNASLGAQVGQVFTILDQDDPPTVDFQLASSAPGEGGGSALITLQLSEVSGQEVSVPFILTGTALDPDDYGFDASPAIIPAGRTSVDLTLTLVDDQLDEDDETVVVTLGNPTGADLGATIVHSATIGDDDAPPTVDFEVAASNPAEGDGTAILTVDLSEASGLDVTVPFTVGGSAVDPDDFTIEASPLVILAGSTSGTVTVTLVDDALDEDDETLQVDLATPTNGTLGTVISHLLTVVDDDDAPMVDFAAGAQSAGEAGGAVSLTVNLSAPSGLEVSVPFTLAGSALETDDYAIDASPLIIPAGQASADIVLTPTDDSLYEPAETVEVQLGAPNNGQSGSTTLHVVTINSDDPPPAVEFTAASQSSGEGLGAVTVSLTLSAVSGTDVVAPLSVSGTATNGVDFTLDLNPVVIPAGALSADTTVTAIADALDEFDETVVLTIDPPTGALLGTTTVHTLTLVDDDAAPTVSFQIHVQGVLEDAGVVLATLELSAVSGKDVTVPFTHNGKADAGSDYTISGSPVVISAGSTVKDILVTILDDDEDEFWESVRVLIDEANLVNAAAGTLLRHRINVEDNDGIGTNKDIAGLRPNLFSLAYPQVLVGQSNGPQTIVLTNTQHVPITFKHVEFEGEYPDDYAVAYGQPVPLVLLPGQSASFDVTFQPTQYGRRDAIARVVQAPHGAPETLIDLSGTALGLPGDELRVAVGPDDVLDTLGQHWSYDFGDTGDSAYVSTGQDLPGDDDALYQVVRVGATFGFAFELPDGDYDVVLHFAELEASLVGERVFDVLLEGALAIDNLDLISVAGAATPWNTVPLRTTVTGGVLDLDLIASVGEASLAAIEITSMPLVSADLGAVNFGNVDQGFEADQTVQLTNAGLADGKVTQLALVLDGTSKGTAEDFSVTLDNTEYFGGVSTVYYAVDFDLPSGQTVPIEVTFEPTEHQENVLRVELIGAFGTIEIDLSGTGGADASWGFLHPVLEVQPALVVDFDQDGSEEVELFGSNSHTHEPGQTLAEYEWTDGGAPFSTDADTTRVVNLGATTIGLTITDDKGTPDSATDDFVVELHSPDAVPGFLCSYYAGAGDPVFLLDNLPTTYDQMERLLAPLVAEQMGLVGGSTFTGDVMVRWEFAIDVPALATYEFLATGGVDHRVKVDGLPLAGPTQLSAGTHDVDLRFAVSGLDDLPLQLDVEVDGQASSAWLATVTHDEQRLRPVIHKMPTVGTELGGNLIKIEGFGFYPKAQVTVHWGATDFTLVDFLSWTDQAIELESPAGVGSVFVSVETPGGLSNSFEFIYSPDGPIPIKFDRLDSKQINLANPTAAAWHGNGKLYVGTLDGNIAVVEFTDDWSSTVTTHTGVSGLTNFDLLGIAINPYDPPDPVKLYVAHGEHFLNGGGFFNGESPFTGQVSILTGPNFDDPVPLITGLPTSNHDHGVNGITFDNNGDLLICVGGNTNAGVKWPLLGDLPGSPFSGAIIKARVSDPAFNGTIQYVSRLDGSPIDDQVAGQDLELDGTADVEVWAAGLRNAYSLTLTSRGLVYATDNGPNVNYGPASTGANTDSGVHPQTDDEVNLVFDGGFFGHANRNRGVDDPRQNIWRSPTDASDAEFTQAMWTLPPSAASIDEYRSDTFNGQLRGRLFVQRWNGRQYILELDEDGRSVLGQLSINPMTTGLGMVTGPGGSVVAMDYTAGLLRILEPDDASAVGVTVHDIHPWRTTEAGGGMFVIGGEGFIAGQTSVTINGLAAALTSVTPRRIRGTFPALPANQIGDLYDVQVSVAANVIVHSGAVLCLPINPGLMRGFWTTGNPMPDPLGEVSSAVVGTTMYVFGEGTGKTYGYDLLGETWDDTLAPRPNPGNHHACEVIGDKLYLIGGLGGGSAGRVQIYDTVLDQWTLGTPMPWAGGSCSSALIGGQIYVCGGIVGNTTVSNLSVYDPDLDLWDQGGALASMPTKVNHAGSATDGNQLWVFGGRQGGNFPQAGLDTVQSYNPNTNTWDSSDLVQSSLEPLPLGRGGTGRAVFHKGEFYLFGGEDAINAFAEVQVYRPSSNTWRDETDMPTARHGVFPVKFQSRMYLVGGGVIAGFSSSDILEIFHRP